jgi:hypothetical protein
MKINPNLSLGGVNGVSYSKAPVAAKDQAESVSLNGSAALDGALREVPDTRASEVARASQLVANPDYPSPAILKKMAAFFADNLSSQTDTAS